MQLIFEEEDLVSNKCKLGLIGQSFFVLSVVAAMSVAEVANAQNPYYSETANSQVTTNGFAPSAQVSANGSALPAQAPTYGNAASAPSVYGTSGVNGTSALNPQSGESAYGSAASAQTAPTSPAVGQYAGDYSAPEGYAVQQVYGAGFTTMPEYPRNNMLTPNAPSTPDPAPSYPQTKEEIVPERIHRDPPLTPYAQQESYSYVTETDTSSSTACQLCNEGYGNPYLWQLGAAAGVKHRARLEKMEPVFFNQSGSTLVDSNTNFPVSAGLDLDVTRYLGRNAFNYDIWMDLHFDGLYEWENEKTFGTSEALYSNYGIAGLTSYSYDVKETAEDGTESTKTYQSVLNSLNMKYQCEMNSAEAIFQFRKRGRPDPLIGHPNGTWTRECQGGPRYTHLLGVNYTSYNEDLSWTGTSGIYDSSNNYVGYEQGRLGLSTDNNLLGLVIGGDFADKHCVWAWGMTWSFTPYLNFMESSMELTNDQNVHSINKLSKTDVSYMAQWGIYVTYKTGKHIVWRLGYDLDCYGNLALAGENVMVSDSIGHNNYNLFQQLSLGLKVVW